MKEDKHKEEEEIQDSVEISVNKYLGLLAKHMWTLFCVSLAIPISISFSISLFSSDDLRCIDDIVHEESAPNVWVTKTSWTSDLPNKTIHCKSTREGQ